MVEVFLILSILILVSMVFDLPIKQDDRLFYIDIVRVLLALLLLIGTYFTSYYYAYGVNLYFYNSENVFSLLWLVLAYRLYCITPSSRRINIPFRFLLLNCFAVVLAVTCYGYFYPFSVTVVDSVLVFPHYGVIYCSALFLIFAVILFGWRLEAFWRSLDVGDKWRFKYLMIGFALACLIFGWTASYRLAYLSLPNEHVLLLGFILIVVMFLMIFAISKHRLLNRKFFVSRKVVYATVTPIVFSAFFIIVGLISLLSRLYGFSVPYVFQWLIIIFGILGITVLAFSTEVRRQVKFFISTNFYVNKYEYRDEWLAFSDLLQGRLTEKGVVEAMYQILRDSLYTNKILVWLGDIHKGFQLIDKDGIYATGNDDWISGNDAIACYLHNAPYLYANDDDADPLRRSILHEKKVFLQTHDIVLMVPLSLGRDCVGFIGIGAEATGGKYGQDDFDLLLALSSHAASALLAVQNAEKLARAREHSAYINLSAFVLHDIKNAATMLDLIRKNADEHMNNHAFQKDMLETIDDALIRMGKVQNRLYSLKGEMVPEFMQVDVRELVEGCVKKLSITLPGLKIELECPEKISIQTDPAYISQILENLFINARESGGRGTCIRIEIAIDTMLCINMQDDGPGIQADLLPQDLFKPFMTNKSYGSGIGLWQVRQLVEGLGGDVRAQNVSGGGASFSINIPIKRQLPS